MAITFVGSHVGTHAATSAQTVNFSNLLDSGGGTPTLAQGDIVYVAVENASTVNRGAGALVPSGYTAAHTANYQNDSNDSNFQVSYKVMGATPDTSVAIPASNATTAGVGYAIYVFRGVSPSAPDDATVVVTGGTNTGVANAAAITPVTAGAWIVVFGGAAVAAGAVFTNPAGMDTTTNYFRSATITSTTNDANIGGAIYSGWTSGSYDPAAFGGSTSTNTGSWSAVTIALKPIQALELDAGSDSYTLSGQDATLSYAAGIVANTLDAAAGSYTVSGQTASTLLALHTNDDAGSYLLSGQDVTFVVTEPSQYIYSALQNEDGTYILTEAGEKILLEPYQISVVNSAGTFTLTGANATTSAALNLNAAVGSYSVIGASASTIVAANVNAASGSYSTTGASASAAIGTNAASGSYTVTGAATTITVNRALTNSAGSYTLTGQATTLPSAKVVNAVSTAYTVSGQDVTFVYVPGVTNSTLDASAGSYSVSGQDASLPRSLRLSADPGSYSVTGASATTPKNVLASLDAGSVTINGAPATVIATKYLQANSSSLAVTGQTTNFQVNRAVFAEVGTLDIVGKSTIMVVTSIFPPPHLVLNGVQYGPTGTEYTGTYVEGTKIELTTGRVIKPINSKVSILL